MPDDRLVLLADDNPDDVFLFRRAFTRAEVRSPLAVVFSTRQAVEYLMGSSADPLRFPRPYLAIVDLRLPDMGGIGLASWLRKDSQFTTLPVVLITGMCSSDELTHAYQAGVNSILIKPGDPEEFTSCIKTLVHFWFKTCEVAGQRPSLRPEPQLN